MRNTMNSLYNAIALRYKQSIVLGESKSKTPATHIRGLLLDISQLGYTLDVDAIRAVRGLNEVEFKEFHKMLTGNLEVMVGGHVKYTPLFINFPEDIPDDEEYFMKRVVGFVTNIVGCTPSDIQPLSCGHVIDTRLFNLDEFGACPICQMQVDELGDDVTECPPLEDLTPLKVIGLVNKQAIAQIFSNLLAAKASISEEDRTVVADLVRSEPKILTYVPDVIPMKENVALIAGLCMEVLDNPNEVLSKFVKTATDVLRFAVQLNDGDVSLKENTRIRLNNKQRRLIMTLLDNVNHPEEDMLRYRMRWIRLAEVLHIGKYAKRFPNAAVACDTLRNKERTIETFNKKVEAYVKIINDGGKVSENDALELLATRPGEFARRLDWMLRKFSGAEAVISTFKGLVDKLPTPMLLTLTAHFAGRASLSEGRYFTPKGSVAKIQTIADSRDTIHQKFITKVTVSITNELTRRFSMLDSLGNVYIDPDLKNYLVPLVQRNASKSLVTVARGSHVSLMESKVARMFLYWKQNKGERVDVDLSAVSYDKDWNYKNHLSFTDLSSIGGAHSGDIQSAPNGAAEFIDITVDKAKANGVRYIVMTLISYTGQNFSTFECFAGVMGRDKVKSGKKFEARAVKTKFDLASETKYNIPLIFDLETNKIIWGDIGLTARVNSYVGGDSDVVSEMGKAIEAMVDYKPNMYDLLWIHAKARGDSVDDERQEGKKYHTEFGVDMASNVDDILANWL